MAAGGLVKWLTGFAKATRIGAAVQWALNVALSANPIGIVVIALAALVGGLVYAYKHSDRFRAICQKVFGWIKREVPAALRRVRDDIVATWQDIRDTFTRAGDRVVKDVKATWKDIRDTFKRAGKRVKDDFVDTCTDIRDTFKRAGKRVRDDVRATWVDIRDTFKRSGKRVKDDVVATWQDVRDTFTGGARRVRTTVSTFGKNIRDKFTEIKDKVKDSVTALFDNKTGLRKKFTDAVTGLGKIWDRLKEKFKTPISAVIGIVNTGLIGAFNWVAGKLKLDSMKLDPIAIKGFHDGGYTGRRPTTEPVDYVHGDEQVIRSPSRRLFEARHPGALDYLNQHGRLPIEGMGEGMAGGGKVASADGSGAGGSFSNPSGRTTMDGKAISRIAAAQIRLAEQVSGINMRLMQGGFGGSNVAASGTSHNYPGVADLSPGNIQAEKILRQVGFASWARNVPGRSRVGSGAHNHAVSLLDPGNRGSAQLRFSWPGHGNGLSGRNNDPAPHYPWLPNLKQRLGAVNLNDLGGGADGSGGSAVSVKAGWLGKFATPVAFLKSRAASMMDKAGLGKLGTTGLAGLVRTVPGKLLEGMLSKIKTVAESAWHTITSAGAGIAQNFVSPGKKGSMSAEQMANAATIASVGSGMGPRAQIIGLITALVESGLRNVNGGDRDSVGLFQQRAPWGPRSVRMNPAQSAAMFFHGGRGGQRGLDDIKGWQGMSPGAAAQAVQVSAFPNRYQQQLIRAKNILNSLKPAGGLATGTLSAGPGVRGVAEDGAELVVGPQLRKFRGGEKVLNARQTQDHLGARQLVGSAQFVADAGATLRDQLEELEFYLRTVDRGGLYVRTGVTP